MSDPVAGGYVDPSWPNPHGPNDASIIIYGYVPNTALCMLGMVLFSLACVVHVYQIFRYRYWSFTPICIACAMEVIGYAFRFLSSHKDPYNIIYFVVAYFFIVTAPVLISASIYICLTKLLRWMDLGALQRGTTKSLVLNPKLVLWVFITADVVSTIVQVTGAALIGSRTSDHKDPTTANNILLGGLAFQTFAFLVFLSLFGLICRELVLSDLMSRQRPFILSLGASSILILLRTVFRLAETAQGVFGHLSSHEAYFGALEFAPVVLAVALLAIWHPCRWVAPGSRRSKLQAVTGKTAWV